MSTANETMYVGLHGNHSSPLDTTFEYTFVILARYFSTLSLYNEGFILITAFIGNDVRCCGVQCMRPSTLFFETIDA